MIAWNKGLTKETDPRVAKHANSLLGNKLSKEHKEKLRQAKLKNPVRYWLDKKRPELKNTRAKETMFIKGVMPWNKDKKMVNQSGKNHPMWKGGLPECLICKKKLSGYKNKYCKAHRGESVKGEKNRFYKGGITSHNDSERVKFRKYLQKKVLKRDNYTCQLCGVKGGNLQVDHIQSWAEYIELRFNIENCRTLCTKCHYKITYGKPMPPTVKAWGHSLKERSKHI